MRQEGLGGMPRYLQILREFLGCDSDYDDEQHVKYDASSLEADVAAQRSFKPEWWEESSRLEPEASATTQPEAEAAQSKEEVWGIDFFSKERCQHSSSCFPFVYPVQPLHCKA
eukprot:s92_g19.t1